MNIFADIIREYEILHITEAALDANLERMARDALKSIPQGQTVPLGQVIGNPAQSAGTITFTKKGKYYVNGAGGKLNNVNILDSGGRVLNGAGWNQFVNYFSEEGETSSPVGDVNARVMGGETIALEGATDRTVEIFKNLETKKDDICSKLKTLKGKIAGESCKKIITHFLGKSPQSFERQLYNTNTIKVAITDDEVQSVEASKEPVSPELVEGVAETFNDFMSTLTKDEISPIDADNIKNMVVVTQEGYVAFKAKGDSDQGIIFSDNTKFLKGLLDGFFPDTKFDDFEFIKAHDSMSGFRSTNLEELYEPLSMLELCRKFPHVDGICEEARLRLRKFAAYQKHIIEAHASWVNAFQMGEAGVSVEDAELLNELTVYFGEDSKNIVIGLLNRARDSIRIRNPDLIVRVGGDTGVGKSTDVLEIWGNREEAIKGISRSGILNPKPKPMVAALAFNDKPEMLSAALKAGVISSDKDTVWVNEVGLKNYTSAKGYKFGENSMTRVNNVLKGLATGEWESNDAMDSARIESFMNSYLQDLGQLDTKSWWEDSAKYHDKLMNISRSIRTLPLEAKVIDNNGDETFTKPLEDIKTNLVNALKDNYTYKERQDLNSIVGKTLRDLEDLDPNKPSYADQVKHKLVRYMTNVKRHNDLKKERNQGVVGPATKNTISEIIAIAGSDNPEFMGDAANLVKGEVHIVNHNDMLKTAIRGMLDGSWDVSFTDKNIFLSQGENRINVLRLRKGKDIYTHVVANDAYLRNSSLQSNSVISEALTEVYKIFNNILQKNNNYLIKEDHQEYECCTN